MSAPIVLASDWNSFSACVHAHVYLCF